MTQRLWGSRSIRWLAIVLVSALSACTGKEPPKVSLDQGGAANARAEAEGGALPSGHPSIDPAGGISLTARTQLDSGNAAFRAKSYSMALRHYREAAAAAPAHSAPWFGIFMIAQATGNKALGDSATAEVKRRTVDPAEVTDSTLRNTHPAPKRPDRKTT